ncbi:MAG: 30S ribosomal protein S6 [Chlamydiae bacterium]|nr:30S ribosomal protein S6 [Chlamydiota bacterium]
MVRRRNKHTYEGMYIIRATLSDEARQKAMEKITSLITSLEGEVHKVIDWGRKKLKYEIKGAREGHYFIVYFSAYSDTVREMWNEYNLHEDLVRFFTLQIEENAVPESNEFTFKPLVEV